MTSSFQNDLPEGLELCQLERDTWVRFCGDDVDVPAGVRQGVDEESRQELPSPVRVSVAVPVRDGEIRPPGWAAGGAFAPQGRLLRLKLRSGVAFDIDAPFNVALDGGEILDDEFNRWLCGPIRSAVLEFLALLAKSKFKRTVYRLLARQHWANGQGPAAAAAIAATREFANCAAWLPDCRDGTVAVANAVAVMSDRTECIQAAERLLDSPNQRRAVVARLDDYLGQLFGEFDVAAFPALDVLTGEPGIGLLGRLGADEFFGNVSDVFRGLGGSLEFKRRVLRALPIPLASGGCAQFAEVLWPREGGDDWLREFVEIKFAEPQVWDRLTTPRGIAQLEPEQRDWGHELEQAAIRRLEHQPDADDVGQHVALRFLATKRSALAANRQAARRVRVLCDGDQSDTRTLADLYSWQGAPQELADVAPRLSNRYPEDVRDAVGRALADFDVDGLLDLISGVEEPSTAVVTWVQELSTKNPDFLRVLRATRYRTVSGEYLPFAEVRTVHDTDRQKVLELAPRKILDWDFYPNLREHLAQNNSLPQPLIPVRRAGGTDVTPTLHAEPEQAPSEVQLELLEFGPAEVRAEDGNHGSESGLHVGFPELGGRAIQTACPHQLDAAACLNKISEWWEDNRERLLREYDEETYPDPGIFEHLRPPYGGEPHRKAWLTLVLRARLESFGQVKPGQNRGFVELFINQGWLDAISEQGAGNDLVTSLRRYISRDAEEVPYAAWLAPLLSVFLVSPWLDDYVRTLLAMNLQDGDVDPAQFLTPAANQAVARGVAAAPPLFPFLGIGACFLFRELKRKGVLTHPSLDSACYVPTRAVRRALSWLGAEGLRDDRGNRLEQSGAVRRFLGKHLGDNADFGGAFDLPLRIALRNGRWRELTGIEIELGDDAEAPEDPDRGGPPG